MAVTVVPVDHFSGNRAITNNPGGDDTRDLREILNEAIAQANTNESDISTNAAAILALGTPLDFKGSISAAADFPTAAAVEDGWTYLIAADVVDNDATKTNTGDAFKEGDEIVWNGTDWTRLGRKVTQLTHSDEQAAAANATTFAFLAMRAGAINGVIAVAETAAAADEDMAIDVQINGTTCLTSAIVLDNAAGTTPVVGAVDTAVNTLAGAVDTAANTLARGDIVTIVRTYTAGGAPTPIANTHCGIAWEETLPV